MRLPLLLSLALVGSTLSAAPIDASRANEIARQIYGEIQGQNMAKDSKLDMVAQDLRHEQPAFYVFQPQAGEGFIIVSGDDQGPELLAYSTTGSYQNCITIQPFAEMIDGYAEVLSRKSKSGGNAIPQSVNESSNTVIMPLVKSHWHQHEPYNNFCPLDSGQHSLTGCTATAMAQVMKYHEYPTNPTGMGSATLRRVPVGNLDFTQYTFEWGQMLNTYNGVEYTEEQANAVATLMLLCGYGANMNYSATGSGAYLTSARKALIDNFNYSTTTHLYLRDSFTREHWLDKIQEELQAHRPLIYSGYNSEYSGHTFVCDGMGLRNTIHINWGWGEGYDANVDCDVLSYGNDGYNRDCQVMFGIQPATEGEDRTMPYNLEICDSVSFKPSNKMVVLPAVYNLGTESLTVDLGFVVEQNGEVVDHVVVKTYVGIESTVHSNPVYAILKFPSLADGTYTFRFGVKIYGEDDWMLVNSGDMLTAMQFTYADGSATFDGFTAIREVRVDDDSSFTNVNSSIQTIYDCTGRRVTGMQPNQIYIVNGKKHIAR